MYIARFRTAMNQKEIVFDAKLTVGTVGGNSNAGNYKDNEGKDVKGLPVGTLLSYNASNDTFTEKVGEGAGTSESPYVAPVVALGDYIIAQSDATMSGGHVPVETLSYKYIGKCDFVGESTEKKPIAVYEVIDVHDVVMGKR